MPLFFKIWFAFVAICVVMIIGGTVFATVYFATNPSVIGRAAGQIVSGFKETAK